MEDVDVGACKIFIAQGKGDKDRYILFPESFRLILKSHLAANPENRFLFESRQRTKYTSRRMQQIVAHYAQTAGLEERVHTHLLRHQMLTWLTAKGLPDARSNSFRGMPARRAWKSISTSPWRRWDPAIRRLSGSWKFDLWNSHLMDSSRP